MAMVKYAFRMLFELERIKNEEDLNFEMRIGLHTGPCIGGVIGRLKPRHATESPSSVVTSGDIQQDPKKLQYSPNFRANNNGNDG